MALKQTSRREQIRQQWLDLLQQAIDEGVKIQVNHRFKYKGKNLGTFLVEAKRRGKPELHQTIKEMGLDFRDHSNKPEDYVQRFIKQLWNDPDPKPKKGSYITRFNTCVLPKKDILKKSTKQELEVVWKHKFGEERPWKKRDDVLTRVYKWKNFRYNRKKNPNKKWFQPKSKMGDLYFWVYARKRKPWLMKAILNQFDTYELKELKEEGFVKESWIKE
jgi:hypothetical protein